MGCQTSVQATSSTDVDFLLYSIERNITVDYESECTTQNLQNVLSLYKSVFSEKGKEKQSELYKQLKSKLKDQDELAILDWIETKRSKKYSTIAMPECKVQQTYRKAQISPSPQYLSRTYTQFMTIQKESIKIGKIELSLQDIEIPAKENTTKTYLCKKKQNSHKSQPTAWIVESTKDDYQYVWRADISIDKYDVETLLKFLLIKQGPYNQCPSILINAGSHGDDNGRNAYQADNPLLIDVRIVKEMEDLVAGLLQNSSKLGLKLDKQNATSQIHIHKLKYGHPCIYPKQADHIIDVQCSGALSIITKDSLAPKKSLLHKEDGLDDLKFLQKSTGPVKIPPSVPKSIEQYANEYANEQQINYLTDEKLKQLAELGKNFPNLQYIYLQYYPITDAGLQALAKHGKNFPNLQTIYLSRNQITDAGLKALAEHGKNFPNLYAIQLNNNQITDAGLKAFAEHGENFSNLHYIQLDSNKITDAGLKALAEHGKNFPNLQGICLRENQITAAGKKILSELKLKFQVYF